MFKKTSRCSILMLLMMGLITLGFSSIVNAQLHGASIQKGCTSPIRACDDDADCGDANDCTADICNDVAFPNNTVECTIEITNIDGFFDTLSVNSVEDVLAASVGDVTTPSTDMFITPLDGATCAGGPGAWELPCTLPRTGPLPETIEGRIRLEFGGYNPVKADEAISPLLDQATGLYFDLCGCGLLCGCDPVTNHMLQAGASTTVVDACENPNLSDSTACTLEDGNECTTSGCDGAGTCNPLHQEVSCPPDDDACTEDFDCNPATGLCPPPGDPTVCDPDDDACTEDFECDSDTGECPPPGDRTVCDPDDDACTEDFECDSDTGECPPPGDRTVCDPDDDACTEDFECDSDTGECPPPGDRTVCDPDDDACTEDFECDSDTGECPPPGDRTVCDPDDDACTEDFECDSDTGECPPPGDRTVCDPDDDACTEDFECDSDTGECPPPGDRTVCDPDDDACTEDFECDSDTGECPPPGDRTVCDPDDDACTEDFECDSDTGECPPPGDRTVCDPDDDACTEDFECDSDTGECPPPGDRTVCDPDDDACTEDFECDSDTGECPPPGDRTVCDPDDDACTEDFECDSDTGECPPPGPPLVCPPRDDGVICDLCDPATGECIPEDPVPDRCLPDEEICRTPGFWGARGGIEKAPKSQNITQAVIDQAILENGLGLPVCGIYIDNTDLLSNFSAIEAICVSVKGVTERQLVRQLTVAALNCVLGDCSLEHASSGCRLQCRLRHGCRRHASLYWCAGHLQQWWRR